MSIFPQKGAKELQRFACFEYYNVLERESRFFLGLNDAKNTAYIKTINQNYCLLKVLTRIALTSKVIKNIFSPIISIKNWL